MREGVLPFDFINTLSPFYIVLDKSGEIFYISPFFKKILINENLSSIKLTRPFSSNIYRSILEELTGMVLFFSIEGGTVRQMKGQSIIYNDFIILVGTPLISSASELEKFGMKMTDLPIHDSTGDLLLAVEANRISLLDAKESMIKLENALEETRKLGENLATAVEIKTIKYKLEKETAEKALSELKESRIALSRAERDASLTQIATHLAHEINNPLNYILTGNMVLSDSLESLISTIKEAIPPWTRK
jgi:signal transduction histidine kinase